VDTTVCWLAILICANIGCCVGSFGGCDLAAGAGAPCTSAFIAGAGGAVFADLMSYPNSQVAPPVIVNDESIISESKNG
jgi:hypothetical protein